MVAARKDKRKEAGHYSGLNENWRSKITLSCNNGIRIADSRRLACHQLWLHRCKNIYLCKNFATASVRVRTWSFS